MKFKFIAVLRFNDGEITKQEIKAISEKEALGMSRLIANLINAKVISLECSNELG